MTLQFMSIDATLALSQNDDSQIFSGDQFLALKGTAGPVQLDYPKTLAEGWPNLPSAGGFDTGNFDGACYSPGKKYCYFFKGGQVLAYSLETKQPVSGYPKALATVFSGWPKAADQGIDGAVGVPYLEQAYIFKGGAFLVIDLVANKVIDGYPKTVSEAWPGWPVNTLFGNGIDAGLWDVEKKQVIFFKSSQYLVFDLTANQVAAGYPKPIGTGWPSWPVGTAPPSFAQFQQLPGQAQVQLVGDYMQIGVLDNVLKNISGDAEYVIAVNKMADGIKANDLAQTEAWKKRQEQEALMPSPPTGPKLKAFTDEWANIAAMVTGFKPGAPLPNQIPSLTELLNQIVMEGVDYGALANALCATTDINARQNLAAKLLEKLQGVQKLQAQILPVIGQQLIANDDMAKLGALNTDRTITPDALKAANKVLLQLQTSIPAVVGQMYANCLAVGLA